MKSTMIWLLEISRKQLQTNNLQNKFTYPQTMHSHSKVCFLKREDKFAMSFKLEKIKARLSSCIKSIKKILMVEIDAKIENKMKEIVNKKERSLKLSA